MTGHRMKEDLPGELREIAELERAACSTAWVERFKSAPPKYLSVSFMRRTLAHDLQCRRLGGHSATTKRALKVVLSGGSIADAVPNVGDGSALVREWNGRTYRVDVTGQGYVLDGRTYPSLSAVAKQITGAHWSGPRFFGLTSGRRA
jgi:hypothetical protein